MVPDVGVDDEPEEGIERVVVAVRGQGNVRLEYNTAVLEEKATACHMLFQYATRLKAGFFPYVQEVLRVLTPLVRYRYNESVRVASVSAVPALITCVYDYIKVHPPSLFTHFNDLVFKSFFMSRIAVVSKTELTCL
jgi:hypothetical protein